MKRFTGFECGMGIGGWLTNYKRFHVLDDGQKKTLTVGDFEHFSSYITEKDIEYIASLGFDHIRLGFDQVVLQDECGRYRHEIFRLLDNFVSWCEKYGLNIVFNLHKAFGNYCDIEESVSLMDDRNLQDGFIRLWTYMEGAYSHKKDIAFELLNEVREVDPALWNDLAGRTIEAIRKINKDRKIIVGTICWNNPNKLQYQEIFDDENVIYTFHMYDPHEFTHQRGVLQKYHCFYNRDMPYPGDIQRYKDFYKIAFNNEKAYTGFDIMDKKYMYHVLEPAKKFIEAHPDVILWCGEFGTIRHARLEWRIAWFKDVISFLKENSIPYCVWNYLSTPNDGNRFSLVDDDNRKILSEELKNTLLGRF
ncbi:MAG: cellulase family glycosylhydrolase [Clostridia bacterium]|nr:cellulase family glycosylhydrolase [Clostridia bacterium]